MKKNIMLMVPLLDQGGLERVCALTANLLNDKCNLVLVVFSTKNMLYDVNGVDMIDLHLGSRPGFMGKVITFMKRIHVVKKIKKQKQIDITYSFGPSANLTNVFTRVKDQIWVGIRGYGALDNKKAMKLLCKKSDMVICCAKAMADDVDRFFHPKKVVCLYNPCDVNAIRMAAQEPIKEYADFFTDQTKIIASMGRENDVKGFWHLIKAFALLKEKQPNVKLMIIGEGDFTEYKKLAAKLGIAESVLFTGVQKNPFCYLQKASLYVLTSASEGFPNALVEAMALGVPAMSVNCKSGPAEILMEHYEEAEDNQKVYKGQYGILLPVMDPLKNLDVSVLQREEMILTEEMNLLLQNMVQLTSYKKASIERSNIFSIESYISEIMSLIG